MKQTNWICPLPPTTVCQVEKILASLSLVCLPLNFFVTWLLVTSHCLIPWEITFQSLLLMGYDMDREGPGSVSPSPLGPHLFRAQCASGGSFLQKSESDHSTSLTVITYKVTPVTPIQALIRHLCLLRQPYCDYGVKRASSRWMKFKKKLSP